MTKQRVIIFTFFTVILFYSCRKNKICPNEVEYHFFDKNELSVLWLNTNTALSLQDSMQKTKEKYGDYSLFDTLRYVNELHDTVLFKRENQFGAILDRFCSNVVPMYANSLFSTNDNISFVKNMCINLKKYAGDTILYTITVGFENTGGGTDFTLNDTIEMKYNVFNYAKSTHKREYYMIAKFEEFSLNGVKILNCLTFKFYNNTELILTMRYSNKYGFIQVLNNNKNEIKQII